LGNYRPKVVAGAKGSYQKKLLKLLKDDHEAATGKDVLPLKSVRMEKLLLKNGLPYTHEEVWMDNYYRGIITKVGLC
jgi:hypothetical protein